MKMLGKKNYPFCGPRCCYEYPYGSGKAHKRIIKKIEKRREQSEWKKDFRSNV